MAVIIALGNDKDLGFIDFQLSPGLEGTDPGSLKHHWKSTGLPKVKQYKIAYSRVNVNRI